MLGAERTPTVARLRLVDGDEVLAAAADLARREKACCGFFSFRLEPLPEELWLEVEVPPDAAAVLDDFSSLVGDAARPEAERTRQPPG